MDIDLHAIERAGERHGLRGCQVRQMQEKILSNSTNILFLRETGRTPSVRVAVLLDEVWYVCVCKLPGLQIATILPRQPIAKAHEEMLELYAEYLKKYGTKSQILIALDRDSRQLVEECKSLGKKVIASEKNQEWFEMRGLIQEKTGRIRNIENLTSLLLKKFTRYNPNKKQV